MRSRVSSLEAWNRRLHYYLGLYFLLFLWLFSATGLMLNHQQWFRNLYERRESSYDMPIDTANGETPAAAARDVIGQLNLRGEIDWAASQPVGHLDFNVNRPSGAAQVRVDLNAQKAYVKEFDNTPLHAFQVFHTFSGSRFTQPESRRDWIVTTAWVLAMDALAAGLILTVLGSYYMWWRLERRHTLGFAVLAAGWAACAAFVAGLV